MQICISDCQSSRKIGLVGVSGRLWSYSSKQLNIKHVQQNQVLRVLFLEHVQHTGIPFHGGGVLEFVVDPHPICLNNNMYPGDVRGWDTLETLVEDLNNAQEKPLNLFFFFLELSMVFGLDLIYLEGQICKQFHLQQGVLNLH